MHGELEAPWGAEGRHEVIVLLRPGLSVHVWKERETLKMGAKLSVGLGFLSP
jgi:hypothetical protein